MLVASDQITGHLHGSEARMSGQSGTGGRPSTGHDARPAGDGLGQKIRSLMPVPESSIATISAVVAMAAESRRPVHQKSSTSLELSTNQGRWNQAVRSYGFPNPI